MSLSTDTVRAALAQIQDPYTQSDLSTAIRGVGVDAGRVAIEIQLGYPAKGWHASLESIIREKIAMWNTVPWYIGINEGTSIRAANGADIQAGKSMCVSNVMRAMM